MNITTPTVSFLPTTAAQPTDVMRRDNQTREIITQITQGEGFARERGIGSDSERSPQLGQQSVAQQYADARGEFARIREREGGGQGGRGNQGEQQQEEQNQGRSSASGSQQNSLQEDQDVRELRERDREVRRHEQTHAAIGGRYASAPNYEFERGPDGRSYAVNGSVNIDITPIPGDPEATIRKMEIVRRAALAPMQPSASDLQAAREADRKANDARRELNEERRETMQARMSNVITAGSYTPTQQQPDVAAVSTSNGEAIDEPSFSTVRPTEDLRPASNVSDLTDDWRVSQEATQPATNAIITRRLDDGSYAASGNDPVSRQDPLYSARGERIERFYQGSFRPNESFLLAAV